jgi:hypothetical protein
VTVWRTRWTDLKRAIRGRTTATLTSDQRITLLGEDEAEARLRYEASERGFGRTPLPRDWSFAYPF